ncbi:hypothetical protein NDA11_001995 [Ustilago hordei]|uniref:Related to GPI-transamidase subunit n=1 Tax=Ustilago hordei TaxID=120017 RepID=I2FW49_USTHO|nr:hypothetical protein NDA10_007680 [Ustilago hordei]KAJ1570624.1 hypothetical protein NDA11_001995 [Ustilago hordei]KAJ1587668.1 hypothetical protein NDA15_007456 [Ustilago hordei]KAJ1590106.1 hypothetical protein NDA12_004097 [Ustilago hordei]KAJ1602134.1 hypothetical protein NDA14_002042 [Ustilago hordei]
MAATAKVPGAGKDMTTRELQPSKSLFYLTLIGAMLFRLGLFLYTDAFELLQDRPELTSPFSSFKSLVETHYLFRHPPTPVSTLSPHYIPDPYSAGTIHHSPLLLPILHHALERLYSVGDELPIALVWIAADAIAGWLLFRICLSRESAAWAKKTHLFIWDQSRAVKVAAIYLFNPFTIATCAARSSTSLEVAALLAAVDAAMSGSATKLAPCWAASSLLSLYPALLFPMLVQLCRKRAGELIYEREIARVGKNALTTDAKTARQLGFLVDRVRSAKSRTILKGLVLMPTALAGGFWISRAIALSPGSASIGSLLLNLPNVLSIPLDSGWAWAEQVYGLMLFATDLTPNLGLWWYFFMEIFDHFRDFFLLTFNVHLACYVLPFSIKYRQDPLFGLTLMSGVIAVFKSYPTVGDHAVFLGLLSLHSQIFEYLRYPLVTVLTYAYCMCLAPAFHHIWLEAGSANSNFFYAITLVWGLGGGMLVLDAMWAWGRERWESERTPIRLRAQQREMVVDADVSVETITSEADVSAERVSAENDKPRRRVVVQV